MSRKNRKNLTPFTWLKSCTSGLVKLTIVFTFFVGGNDYQITTVIQISSLHAEPTLQLVDI